ncbi:MAG: 4-hydroxy-3-methylbut-2-enyl diphosphate reductase, partial [Patescibacteria group bacterium]|nr:4-hydroxy-3-methylbut-2-enyl diphosphate reductase [Patescibacteria group bacterium]
MHIIMAAPRGFCAGVNMAIESLERAIELHGSPVYVFHEIVHNRWVVERFHTRGVVFVNALEEVPEGATLLFSAHGVAPEVRRTAETRGLRVIDATCPLVTKVHREAKRLADAGFSIVLIGHPGHDEVVGTLGEAPEAIVLVETLDDVEKLRISSSEAVAY